MQRDAAGKIQPVDRQRSQVEGSGRGRPVDPALCVEAEIAISTLLRRLPDLRLDDAENPEWRPTFVLRGLTRLPASW